MHAADAVVDQPHRLRQRRRGREVPYHLGAEPVVAEEDVADPGDQDPQRSGLVLAPDGVRVVAPGRDVAAWVIRHLVRRLLVGR